MLVVLNQNISFLNIFNNETIELAKGTVVYLDVKEGIAFAHDCHFTLDRNEYTFIVQTTKVWH